MPITAQQWEAINIGCTAFTFLLIVMRLYVQIRRPIYTTTPPLWTRITLEALVVATWLLMLYSTTQDHKMTGVPSNLTQVRNSGDMVYVKLLKACCIGEFLYVTPMYLIKLHFLLLYRVALIPKGTNMTKMRKLLNYVSIFVIFCWLFTTLLAALICPIRHGRTTDDFDDCSPMAIPWVFGLYFGLHILTDVMVYFIPVPVLLKLQKISLRQKIYAASTFGCGFICFAFAVTQMAANLTPAFTILDSCMIMEMENVWALITACMPAFRLFLRQAKRRNADPESVVTRNANPRGNNIELEDTGASKDMEGGRLIFNSNSSRNLTVGSKLTSNGSWVQRTRDTWPEGNLKEKSQHDPAPGHAN